MFKTIVNNKASFKPLKTYFDNQELERTLSNDKVFFKTIKVEGREPLKNTIDDTEVRGRAGSYYYGRQFAPRTIIVTLILEAADRAYFLEANSRLTAFLSKDEPKKLSFSDESEKFYHGIYQETKISEEKHDTCLLEVSFLCHDPFKYGLTKSQSLSTTRYNITYNGDFPCKPKMTIRTQAGSEIVLTHVQTGKYIRLKGTYIAGSSLVIDCASRKITLNGRNELANFDMVNSRFFEFTKGANTLNVTGGTLTKVEWQEVFA